MTHAAAPALTPHEVTVSPLEKFREFLATRSKRLTQERETIVREIFADHEHFDCDRIVARLTQPRRDGGRVSRATVYRTIRELENAGLIRKVARARPRSLRTRLRLPPARSLHLRKVQPTRRISKRGHLRTPRKSLCPAWLSHDRPPTGSAWIVCRLCQAPGSSPPQAGYDLKTKNPGCPAAIGISDLNGNKVRKIAADYGLAGVSSSFTRSSSCATSLFNRALAA